MRLEFRFQRRLLSHRPGTAHLLFLMLGEKNTILVHILQYKTRQII
jgi:hypothetical protein